jgi:CRISPR/Cas system-associated exonuclease Cas4 (RecB family)
MKKKYRTNGAIGALLDEYEKSVNELKEVILNLTTFELTKIVDEETKDEDCRSIQTILSHVVESGYTYVIEIRKSLGENVNYMSKELLSSTNEYAIALEKMFAYNEKLFEDYPNIKLEAYDSSGKFKVRWGQIYDVEQIFEHAIVHILRHRRQIERFKLKLANENAI